ncbi:protein YqeH [Porphyridium purpureum]|uniref:Protein YqeH n=1 Tax=Porphyridium purpureum TaxID=35688 RepID=A0A5J4YH92_PORPP|nr:protein YqeH [Porphyridium purpureum]|eukprot:POR7648..scf270_19
MNHREYSAGSDGVQCRQRWGTAELARGRVRGGAAAAGRGERSARRVEAFGWGWGARQWVVRRVAMPPCVPGSMVAARRAGFMVCVRVGMARAPGRSMVSSCSRCVCGLGAGGSAGVYRLAEKHVMVGLHGRRSVQRGVLGPLLRQNARGRRFAVFVEMDAGSLGGRAKAKRGKGNVSWRGSAGSAWSRCMGSLADGESAGGTDSGRNESDAERIDGEAMASGAGEEQTSPDATEDPRPADSAKTDAILAQFNDLVESMWDTDDELDDDEDDADGDQLVEKQRKPEPKPTRYDAEGKMMRVLESLLEPLSIGISRSITHCPGCGSEFQTKDATLPGFILERILEEASRGSQTSELMEKPILGGEAQNATDTDSAGTSTKKKVWEEPDFDIENVIVDKADLLDPLPPKRIREPRDPTQIVCQRCHTLKNRRAVDVDLRVTYPSTRRALLRHEQSIKESASSKLVDSSIDSSQEAHVDTTRELRPATLTPESFRKTLRELQKLRCVVVYLVDVFDFHGTFLTDLAQMIGNNTPVVLAVNKIDLLPPKFVPARVARWVREECKDLGLHRVESIHLISCRSGLGVRPLISDALKLSQRYRGDVYVVGAANVGKSSFINMLLKTYKNSKQANQPELSKEQKQKRPQQLTTSFLPGTTLGRVKIELKAAYGSLFDTPGIIVKHQLTNMLTMEELAAVVPQKKMSVTTLRVPPGKSMYVGALARMDNLEGRPYYITAFFSSLVKIHLGPTEGADDFTRRHVGGLLFPPYSAERLEELGEWDSKVVTVEGGGSWKTAFLDVVFSGLGWISLTGCDPARFRVATPKGVGIFTREPLMPFEVMEGVSTYTGSHTVNRKKNKPGRKRKSNRGSDPF